MAPHRVVPSVVLVVATVALSLGAACGDDGEGAGGAVLPPGMQQPVDNPAPAPAIPFSPATPMRTAAATASWPHDTRAFTEGLFLRGDELYESTGNEGASSIRRVDLATGAVKQQVDLPRPYFGEGIAIVGDRLYQLTWKHQKGFVYDAATLAPRDSFTYTGEGWSLTTDGTLLYMSDGTSRLRVVNPDGFRVERTIDVTEAGRPVYYLNELEWVKGELWANVWLRDTIARIDPADGHILGYVDIGALAAEARAANPNVDVTNGIAYDAANDRVLVTGKYWPKVYAIALNAVAGSG